MRQQQIINELRLRAQILPRELRDWRERAEQDLDAMGIHRSQIRDIQFFLDDLQHDQRELIAALEQASSFDALTHTRLQAERHLAGTQSIAAVFRHILLQRSDTRLFRAVLDAADLVAAECYLSCIDAALGWGALAKEALRVPPLVYLNSGPAPAAYTRRAAFGAFPLRFNSEYFSSRKLPVSVIALPFDHSAAIWNLCSIYHEVGHLLDQDLGLQQALLPAVEAASPPEQRRLWSAWLREMIADAFGVLFGGEGFLESMLALLLLPRNTVITLDTEDRHPAPFLRVHLLGALLGRLTTPQAANQLIEPWLAAYSPPSEPLSHYMAVCDTMSEVVLDTALEQLVGHPLCDLASGFAEDMGHIQELATYFQTKHRRPAFPARLAPAAAQLAIQRAATPSEQEYARIHDLAMAYIQSRPRQQFLSASTIDADTTIARRSYLRSLASSIGSGSFNDIDAEKDQP